MNKIKRTISILFGIAMLLVLMSATALADEIFPTDVGADFTSGDGSAALNLLNAAKTGSEDSTWDGSTLILNGVNYNASESGALKLPKDATIVLADGTTNTITGGNASVNVSGEYNNKVYIYGIYAEGNLTIKGGEAGTGTLTVTGGDITNIGNSYTYSAGLYAAGRRRLGLQRRPVHRGRHHHRKWRHGKEHGNGEQWLCNFCRRQAGKVQESYRHRRQPDWYRRKGVGQQRR